MGVAYRLVTFRIEPSATEEVTGIANTGQVLSTYWAIGFQGGSQEVLDPEGNIVASNGELLPIPQAEWPRLHGYFVCPTPDALYVLVEDPE